MVESYLHPTLNYGILTHFIHFNVCLCVFIMRFKKKKDICEAGDRGTLMECSKC